MRVKFRHVSPHRIWTHMNVWDVEVCDACPAICVVCLVSFHAIWLALYRFALYRLTPFVASFSGKASSRQSTSHKTSMSCGFMWLFQDVCGQLVIHIFLFRRGRRRLGQNRKWYTVGLSFISYAFDHFVYCCCLCRMLCTNVIHCVVCCVLMSLYCCHILAQLILRCVICV